MKKSYKSIKIVCTKTKLYRVLQRKKCVTLRTLIHQPKSLKLPLDVFIYFVHTTNMRQQSNIKLQNSLPLRRRGYFESLGHVSSPRVRHVCISWDTLLELPLCGPSVTAYPPSSSSSVYSRTYVVNAGQTVGEVT
ncbi:hypothetical protein ANTRET_LOCUS4195 [Anthophora retusa]